jgi:hypothetical protein
MKTPPEKASALQSPFDEWTKALAHGLTRRKSLQLLLGSSLSGALLTLGLPKTWATPTAGGQGCGSICAPLFNPHNQAAFESCTNACEDCKSCQGTPTLTSTQVLVCNNATPCRSASGLACCQTGQNCCGAVCCSADCCAGTCLPACPPGQIRDPNTCNCIVAPLFSVTCFCSNNTGGQFSCTSYLSSDACNIVATSSLCPGFCRAASVTAAFCTAC